MKYYQESTAKELSRKGVQKTLPNISLKRNWTSEDVITDFTEIVETTKPVITNLQIIQNGGIGNKTGNTRPRIWIIKDKFSDIEDGLTKLEQETIFLSKEFETSKTNKLKEINELFKVETDVIKGGVMQEEVDTFGTQEAEALAYQIDPSSETPVLTSLALIRGMEKSELVIRVIGHANAYKTAISTSMGKKHSYEDEVKLAKTLDDLLDIEVI